MQLFGNHSQIAARTTAYIKLESAARHRVADGSQIDASTAAAWRADAGTHALGYRVTVCANYLPVRSVDRRLTYFGVDFQGQVNRTVSVWPRHLELTDRCMSIAVMVMILRAMLVRAVSVAWRWLVARSRSR